MSLDQLKARLALSAAEGKRRAMESLRLYRPLPTQLPFHDSDSSERVVRGGNRSGKSTSAAIEFASAATGIPLTSADGKLVPFRYPTDRPLQMWVFGWDQKHIGKTIYRLLFRPGVFKMIRDRETGLWRAWRPWEPDDAVREKEVKPAPPLIPKRFILGESYTDSEGWAWENKGERVFTLCRLKSRWREFEHGTEIRAFSSKAEVPQGDPCDVVWIDEDIKYPKHVGELQARLSDNRGRLFWSAFPHSKNEALVKMVERAKEQEERESPDVSAIQIRFSDNPFIDDDEKRKRLEGWDENERKARDEGEFLTDAILMYPNFSVATHGSPPAVPDDDDKVDAILRARRGQPPDNWTRYLILDPGHARPAVLFGAIPPPHEFGDYAICYDEIYQPRIDAGKLADLTLAKAKGRFFEAFIIDDRAGRQTPMGFGHTVHDEYARAFADRGLRSRQTGHRFRRGSDNVAAGIQIVRRWLMIRSDGTTKLKVVPQNCPNLVRQFEAYRKKCPTGDFDVVLDEPELRQKDDLMACIRYWAAYDPKYVEPERVLASTGSAAYRAYLEMESEAEARRDGSDSITCGPSAAA